MREVNVVFDTSVLFTDKDFVVCSELEDFFREFSKKCNLKLYIPEVVKGELCYQKVTKTNKNLKKIEDLMSSMGKILDQKRKNPYKIEELKPLVEKKFDKWANKKNIIILDTPLNKISLKDLQEKSIWRIPPFQDVKKGFEQCKKCRAEKGFRDSLIFYTVIELIKKKTRHAIYFICGDVILSETVRKQNKNKKLIVLEKIEELSSRLRLSFKEDNEKWINSISNKAKKVFYERVWDEYNIKEEIEKKYKIFFEAPSLSELDPYSSLVDLSNTPGYFQKNKYRNIYDPNLFTYTDKPNIKISDDVFDLPYQSSSGTKAVPLDEGIYYLDNPSFQKVKDNKIYVWKSKVSFHRKYREPWDIGITLPKICKIHFNVIWSARVTKDERFYDLKLLNIKFIDKEFTLDLD